MNINLSDPTTLQDLFAKIDNWDNLPANSLSPQQVALMNLKNCTLQPDEAKYGGTSCQLCFVCYTGA